jgi:phosphoglycolate phosphatase-like HAD superfamily hydrolase
MFSNVEAVLFDLDGTLIDSAPDLGAAADKMRTDRGLPSLRWPPTGPWLALVRAACWALHLA